MPVDVHTLQKIGRMGLNTALCPPLTPLDLPSFTQLLAVST
jgi:hypothetical protein